MTADKLQHLLVALCIVLASAALAASAYLVMEANSIALSIEAIRAENVKANMFYQHPIYKKFTQIHANSSEHYSFGSSQYELHLTAHDDHYNFQSLSMSFHE